MTNLDKVSAGLSEWAFNVAKAVLPHFKISPNSTLGHMMGLIGADPVTYNVWNELGFLAEPLIQSFTTPAVNKLLGGIPDEQIPELVNKYVDAFIKQAQEKGSVDLFGLKLGANAFEGLKDIMSKRLA